MRVDSYIVTAIDSYLSDKKVGCAELADHLSVSPASITKWRKVGNGITPRKWEALFALLKPYLPADRIYIDDAGKEQYSSNSSKASGYYFEPKYIPIMVPMFSMDQLSKYDDMLESVIQFAEKNKVDMIEYRPHHPNKSGVMAVLASNPNDEPALPAGARVFACMSDRPQDGGLVVALPAGAKSAIIGRYIREGDGFAINSVSTGKMILHGKTKDARKLITWAFPVLQYEVILSA